MDFLKPVPAFRPLWSFPRTKLGREGEERESRIEELAKRGLAYWELGIYLF